MATKWEQSTLMTWIKDSVQNSQKVTIDYNSHMKKTRWCNDQNIVTITTKMRIQVLVDL